MIKKRKKKTKKKRRTNGNYIFSFSYACSQKAQVFCWKYFLFYQSEENFHFLFKKRVRFIIMVIIMAGKKSSNKSLI